MKAQIYRRSFSAAGLVVLLALSAGCKKSGNDNSQQIGRAGRASVAAVPYGQAQVNPLTGQVSQTQSAYVTSSTSYDAQFQQQVKSLVSGQMDPQYVGRVSPTDGVLLRGYVEVDQQGRVMPQNSRLSLEIRDEYANQRDTAGNTVPPITMTLPAYQGYAYNGTIQLIFQDSVGAIYVYGNHQNGGVISGQVYFANTRSFDGTTVNMQPTLLGGFQIQTCGFFRCQ